MEKCLHILIRNKLSGAEKMALLICKNLKTIKPIVICGGNELKSIFEKNKIDCYSLNFSKINVICTIKQIKSIVEENDINIIHAHDNRASLICYLAKKFYKLEVKIISHIHSCYPFLKNNGINKFIDSIARSKYDYNIVCGSLVKKYYEDNTTYYEKCKSIVLTNAIDVKDIEVLREKDDIKKELNIPNEKFVFGFIGRICYIKGLVPFIEELSKHKEDFIDSKILIVGSGEQENQIKSLLKELGLEDIVNMVGFQEDVHKFYKVMDAFILPSLYEGLPMVLLEAMASNKIVVSMNVGGISEIIENNNTGYLIREKEYFEFVEKLKWVKENKCNIKHIEKKASKFVNNNFNIERYIDKLEEIYKIS